jgi:hypothetical protein
MQRIKSRAPYVEYGSALPSLPPGSHPASLDFSTAFERSE